MLQDEIDEQKDENQVLTNKTVLLTAELDQFKKDNQTLSTDLKHYTAQCKTLTSKNEKLVRENEELRQMWNHEAYKYHLDN